MSFPIPLKIRVPKNFAGITTIIAIRVQDVARDIWYSWDKNSTYPDGYWNNAGGTGTNNAPPGETPAITPGPNNLYVAFWAVNNYNSYVSMALWIYDGNYNTIASRVNLLTPGGGGEYITYAGVMPADNYTLILLSQP